MPYVDDAPVVLYFSATEMAIICEFWDLYVQERMREENDWRTERNMDALLDRISKPSREAFLDALRRFEDDGVEFAVRVARDDLALVK